MIIIILSIPVEVIGKDDKENIILYCLSNLTCAVIPRPSSFLLCQDVGRAQKTVGRFWIFIRYWLVLLQSLRYRPILNRLSLSGPNKIMLELNKM